MLSRISFHRIICFGRDALRLSSPAPLKWTGTPIARSNCSDLVQFGLECLQGKGTHNLLGNLLQRFTALIVKCLLLTFNLNFPLFWGEIFSHLPIAMDSAKESVPFFLIAPPLSTEKIANFYVSISIVIVCRGLLLGPRIRGRGCSQYLCQEELAELFLELWD